MARCFFCRMTTPFPSCRLVMKNPGYDSASDFVPVAGFATFVNAFAVSGLAHPPKPSTSMWRGSKHNKLAKARWVFQRLLQRLNFWSKWWAKNSKLDLVSAPYRGSAPMMADMLGNQIAAGVGSVPDFIENHKAGKVRVVAVLGGKRQAALARCADLYRTGLGWFRGHALLRHLCACWHTQSHHRSIQPSVGQSAGHA